MQPAENQTYLVQSHRQLDPFNYDLVVDWALEQLKSGKETDNLIMLASFSKPVDSVEIKPYVSKALEELELPELEKDDAERALIYSYVNRIVKGIDLEGNLSALITLNYRFESRHGLKDFYFLDLAWTELGLFSHSPTHATANRGNIRNIIRKKAKEWVEVYWKIKLPA